MRLLEKKEVAQKREAARAAEIQEGIKLARKVDSLRETAVREEAALNTFRTETKIQVIAEIDVLSKERDILTSEVDGLRRERKVLRIPLDAEWEELRAQREEIERAKDDIEVIGQGLITRENEVTKAEKLIRTDEARVADMKERALKNVEETHNALAEADIAKKDALDAKRSIESFSKNKTHELLSREAGIAARERNNQLKSESLDERERELNARETRIEDRYQTLLRDEKRNVIHNP